MSDAMSETQIHLEMDAPTSLHGNGAASFALTTRDPAQVSCRLCLYLWHRNPFANQSVAEPVLSGQDSGECEHGDHGACDGTTPGWECLCSCHTTDQSVGGWCVPDEEDPEFCSTHEDGMFTVGSLVCDSFPDQSVGGRYE